MNQLSLLQRHPRRGLCRSCYQRLWRAGDLERYPVREKPAGTHDCTRHPEPCNACSAICGCRCRDCRQAHAAYERNRRRQKAYGTWQGWVDAAPAAAHLKKVMAPPPGARQGIGRRTVARATGVPPNTIRDVVRGTKRRLTPENARKLLAFDGHPVGASQVSATKARRQVAEMIAGGFTPTELARYVTGTVTAKSTVVTGLGRRVTAQRADSIADLHARWKDGEVVPRGRRNPHEYGPASPVPATVPQGCEECGADTFGGGRWCWNHYSSRARRAPARGCGTDAGYTAHRRAGTEPCPACREAHHQAAQIRRAS